MLEGGTVIDESDLIPQRERGGEYLMLRLRTTRGIEEWEYRREFFMNFDPIEQKLEEYERRLGGAARPPLESDGQGLPGVQPAHWGAAVHSGGGHPGKDAAPAEAGKAGGG